MREIKFRAWNGKSMLPPISTEAEMSLRGWTQNDNYILMQYTGLKDSNGEEIYEGDIVRWDDASGGAYWRVAEVVYQPGHFTFKTIPDLCVNCLKNRPHDFKMGCFSYCPDASSFGNVLEVIGNIYENPKLIESKTNGN